LQDLELLLGSNWRSLPPSKPIYVIYQTPHQIQLVPATPSGFADTLVAYAVVIPSNLTGAPVPLLRTDTDAPAFPEIFHRALAFFAMRELMLRDPANQAQVARGQNYNALYLSLAIEARRTLDELKGYPALAEIAQPAPAGRE
jgi:hypothetical protein